MKMFKKSNLVINNSTIIMNKLLQAMDIIINTASFIYSAQTVTIEVAHAKDDYDCSNHKF